MSAERFRALTSDPTGETVAYWRGKALPDMTDEECAAAHARAIATYGTEERFAQSYRLQVPS